MRTAICPGSFDPITRGHLDLIRRAAALFDRVIVCVMSNGSKDRGLFSPERRLRLAQLAVADLPNVEAELWTGLLAEFCAKRQAQVIVKGVRNATDFDWEYQMTWINRGLGNGPETVLLPAAPEYLWFSSTMAREMIRYGQDLRKYLPSAVAEEIIKGIREYGEQ